MAVGPTFIDHAGAMRVSLTVTAKVQLLAAAEDCWDEVAFIGSYLRALHDKRNGKFELVRYTKAGLIRCKEG